MGFQVLRSVIQAPLAKRSFLCKSCPSGLRVLYNNILLSSRSYSTKGSAFTLIKKLRQETNAPIFLIKEAVEETNGQSFFEAKSVLSEKMKARGQRLAQQLQGRVAKQGWICTAILPDAQAACMLELNCESDFVAQNPKIQRLALSSASSILHSLNRVNADSTEQRNVSTDLDSLKKIILHSDKDSSSNLGNTLFDAFSNATSTTGERIELSRAIVFQRTKPQHQLGRYTHGTDVRVHSSLGRVGCLVSLSNAQKAGLADDIAREFVAQDPESIDDFLHNTSVYDNSKTMKDLLGSANVVDWVRWERGQAQ
ncbi:translation elongation factor EF- Ts Tsf1 [Schizosaccharomyces japonicus yFS275]|uniref:Elongation factor Ts, mitochondrial n=1 Tax=Schizosaccharomyces japonicus (strain yFS275 / FY16936) TaxID=402676 RepID=EFTS_SCHJY|nr:translation elongation factor EF- Ts Tsf1 [Schizosaccharomyces japonicus yFS275]B6K2P1.1 RecName: Full=Elongation factor Ts, mitochondrial; Short=EF-Ts; Short=EF-TsMt; Flags: Precursor [Schizosaccharomyces japonicus yFS275]EEB07422.1 translation elongation factor EF- Ts Tsf1 [Schizosaccharomyces japonicus yFS275]